MADTKMGRKAENTLVSPDTACHFLRIPKETRLEIYRYLLLPDSYISFYCLDDDSSSDGSSSHDSFSSAGFEDFWDKEDDEKRNLAILRTNKQIHSEAMSLFYSEAILDFDQGDIFSLATDTLEFGIANDEVAWKHNPLDGVGKKNPNGVVVYNKASRLSGDIEPHIFANFQKISFDMDLDAEQSSPFEMWIDDDTHVVRAEDAAKFKKLLQSSDLIKDLVKILSNSPRITYLEITLEVEVMANSKLISELFMAEDEESEDDEEENKTEKIENIANEKATELFLDSGIMEPLKTLSNVSSCNFKLGFDQHRAAGDEYKPSAKYVRMLKEYKDTIESNFKKSTVKS